MIQKIILLVCVLGLSNCATQKSSFYTVAKLSSELEENSGIVYLDNSLWVINDSGNSDHLYGLTTNGDIQEKIKIKNGKNIDWEDLATDKVNHIFIGDFGNNDNNRDDLAIYIVNIDDIKDAKLKAKKIKFSLEDQENLNPKKKNRNFDIEAFVYHKNGFYLFTKNRSSNFDGITKVYRLELGIKKQKAKLIAQMDLCDDYDTCQVTGAGIYNNQIALLTHDKIYIVNNFEENNFTDYQPIQLGHFSQKEAICYENESFLYITDEQSTSEPPKLYQFVINKEK